VNTARLRRLREELAEVGLEPARVGR